MGSLHEKNFRLEHLLATAAAGCIDACYDLGVAYSTATAGAAIDAIEAHKWFNLAAVRGHVAAQEARAEIADDMTAREIATAQRAARDWLALTQRRAA